MSNFSLLWQRLDGRGGHEAGRELLAQAYREMTGRDCPNVCIGPRGKPYFADSSLHFSISHTKNHVFCALSDCPIGIDAEETGRRISPRLAEKILSPAEMARYDGSREMLLRFWVLKEASVKLSGEGLRGYPNHTDFDPHDSAIQEIDGCLVAVLQGE